ncbi:MAG TPA: RodZ domain-containing protein [Dongiaceae bacterium]
MEPQYRTETPQEQRSERAGDAPPAQRESVGMLLRQKRESFRQDLYTVAGQLHIRLSYLKAIEDGRFKDLPGLTYASGFVRSYADYLGLDGEEMVRRFREEIAGMDRQVQLIFPSLATEGKIPSGAVLLLSGFLAVMAYGAWYYLADRQKSLLDLVPEVPAQLRALLGTQPANTPGTPGEGQAKPGAAAVATAGPAGTHDTPVVAKQPVPPPAPPPPATTVLVNPGDLAPLPSDISALIAAAEAAPVAAGANTAMSSTVAGTTPPTPQTVPSLPMTTTPAVTAPPASVTSTTPAAGSTVSGKPGQVVVTNPGAHVKLTARMDSWVQIYDKAGKSYFSAVLRAGQTIEVPNQPGLLLTTGNIGGLDILIDGQALAALGSVGLVKRDMSLDVAQLKSASATGQ